MPSPTLFQNKRRPIELDMDLLLNPYTTTPTPGASLPSYSLLSNRHKALADIPVPARTQIAAYPAQYSWPPISPSSGGGIGVGKVEGNDRGMVIDPTLSSVRSSAGNAIPELNLPIDDNMNALDSPGLGGAGDVSFEGMGEGSNSANDMLGLPEDDKAGGKDGQFSRSPELRVSHKLAERKRRKEMKDLFDELRESLPADRGMKASKWEILSKAVDFITHIKSQNHDLTREVESLRRELEMARGPNYRAPHQMSTYVFPGDGQPMFPNIAQATAAATTPVQGAGGDGNVGTGDAAAAAQGDVRTV